MKSKYGICSRCETDLVPVWFTEEEINIIGGTMIKTGRERTACSHLECPSCFTKECVDDTFDTPWHR